VVVVTAVVIVVAAAVVIVVVASPVFLYIIEALTKYKLFRARLFLGIIRLVLRLKSIY